MVGSGAPSDRGPNASRPGNSAARTSALMYGWITRSLVGIKPPSSHVPIGSPTSVRPHNRSRQSISSTETAADGRQPAGTARRSLLQYAVTTMDSPPSVPAARASRAPRTWKSRASSEPDGEAESDASGVADGDV